MKKKLGNMLLPLCVGSILGLEIALAADAAAVLLGNTTPLAVFLAVWLGSAVLLTIVLGWKIKRILGVMLGLPAVLGLLAAAGYLGWYSFSSGAEYFFADGGKEALYADRRVMAVVPHQDDEVNILGGVMEEYVRYGSELYCVFVTNGDYAEAAENRYREALAVFESIGVPPEQVIFLGYGDGWQEDGPHIYNAEPDRVMTSYSGNTKTFGTDFHDPYREGRDYTLENLTEDLKQVILEYRPDVLFCSDYDHHIDHKAVTLLFDRVMGQILKETPGYSPAVYKAYAYGTAWEAEQDYYADNILSTRNLFEKPYEQQPALYRWEDRVRFPVDGSTLSRSLVGSDAYDRLALYDSQGATVMAAGVISGDRVAWQRRTDSLCLRAEIAVSSGRSELLNDFMLMDNHCLAQADHRPYDGVWIPDIRDGEPTAEITLGEPADLTQIVLYDHPSPEHNVLEAEITFDDGTRILTGSLDPGGAATVISVEKEGVSSFRVTLVQTQGDEAGLSEIEAFSGAPEEEGAFIKLMDPEGNFVYDYLTEPEGSGEFALYLHGDLPRLQEENYTVICGSTAGTASLENGVIRVSCPVGESFTLEIRGNEAPVSDCIYVRNPGRLERLWGDFWQNAEEQVFSCHARQLHRKLLIPTLMEKLEYLWRHML